MTLRDVTLCILGTGLAVALGTSASLPGDPEQETSEAPHSGQMVTIPQPAATAFNASNNTELDAGNPLPAVDQNEAVEQYPGGLNGTVITENLIFARSVDGQILFAHCNRTGTWSLLQLSPGEELVQSPAITKQVLLVRTNQRFAACSGLTGEWDSFPVDATTKVTYSVEQDRCRVEQGEVLYVYSAHSGKWASMDFAAPVDVVPNIPNAPQVIIP